MNDYRISGYKRIDKREARKLYNAGKDVFVVPCRINPNNCWGLGMWVNIDNEYVFENDFDKVISYYEMYNCQYNEWGRYSAYYIKKEVA